MELKSTRPSIQQTNRLTKVRGAGGEQASARAAALLRQVDRHPDVLHPALHLWGTAVEREMKKKKKTVE